MLVRTSIKLAVLAVYHMSSHLFFHLYQDACNRKSNQQNLGTIKSSNLCTEIVEYTAPDEMAVCNLASIALPRFVREKVRLKSQRGDAQFVATSSAT